MKSPILFTAILCFCLLGANAQNLPSDKSKDGFNNDGNLLPEVIISDEWQIATLQDDDNPERAEEFQNGEFKRYTLRVEQAIAKNENDIAEIKSKLAKARGNTAIKERRRIAWLEIENDQLKTDLWNYLHYGMGNWQVFKEELNEDLQPLAEELASFKNELP
jgi:hypothetical protein